MPDNLRTKSVYAFIQYGQSLLLAIYGKILKGERLKIITTIVLKVKHFYNAVMQPKWQINTELNDFRKIICLTKSKVFV